jgi:hypothetical protein
MDCTVLGCQKYARINGLCVEHRLMRQPPLLPVPSRGIADISAEEFEVYSLRYEIVQCARENRTINGHALLEALLDLHGKIYQSLRRAGIGPDAKFNDFVRHCQNSLAWFQQPPPYTP